MSSVSPRPVRRSSGLPPEAMNGAQAYQAALRALCTQRGDALALAREAARADPALIAAHQLEAWLLLANRDLRNFQAARRMSDRLAGELMSAREARHAEALVAAAAGDYAAAA